MDARDIRKFLAAPPAPLASRKSHPSVEKSHPAYGWQLLPASWPGCLLKAWDHCKMTHRHGSGGLGFSRRKYEPTHQWMPCGTIAAPPQSVEVATPPPPCVEVAALWPTYSRITVVIHHPWRATGPSTGMGRDRFSHKQRGAKIAPTS